jgi:hypothetical protein
VARADRVLQTVMTARRADEAAKQRQATGASLPAGGALEGPLGVVTTLAAPYAGPLDRQLEKR